VIGLGWIKERGVTWRLGAHREHFGRRYVIFGQESKHFAWRDHRRRRFERRFKTPLFFGHLLNLLLEDVGNQAIVGLCQESAVCTEIRIG